jgi:hypothetical protein
VFLGKRKNVAKVQTIQLIRFNLSPLPPLAGRRHVRTPWISDGHRSIGCGGEQMVAVGISVGNIMDISVAINSRLNIP